jgi:hypothetical protein
VNWTYNEEGFLCYGKTSFLLKPPKAKEKRTKKAPEKNDRGGSSRSGKDIDERSRQ